MKKSNLVTLLSLCFLIVAVILFMFFWKAPSANIKEETGNNSTQTDSIFVPPTSTNTNPSESNTLEIENSLTDSETDTSKPTTISMDDALFIGDSRTVGIMEYAGIEDADFFCLVGMTVYNIQEKTVSVPNVGKVTLSELLNGKTYGKIYIMLGINELGYEFNSIVSKYSELIEFIESKQPNANIFIQANLHLTKSHPDNNKVINNNAINRLNTELSKFADGKGKFYLDANTIFDDANGVLSSDKSSDGVHLYAKYYTEWGKWIIRQTASLIGEG